MARAGCHMGRVRRCLSRALTCGCMQRDAAHTVTLLQTLPGDFIVAFFAAVNS